LTLWRVRPSKPVDPPGARMLVHRSKPDASKKDTPEYTPERVSASSPLAEGECVQIGIESGRRGYLYVVTRERYADGGLGVPFLIFPSTELNQGRNDVRAGRPVAIPGWNDDPPCFEIKRSRDNYIGETLIV